VCAIKDAIAAIRRWGEAREWRGADPYDALNSPLAPAVTLSRPLGRRLLTQAVKLSPVNLRPALLIKPEWNAKAIGLVASAYAHLAAAGDESAPPQAVRWLSWLEWNHSGDDSGLAWGYPFEVQTRFFRYARGTPNTIATTFVAHAFLDAAELLGDPRWRGPAESASAYLTERMLHRESNREYFRYVQQEPQLVHNANLLACSVLARVGRGDEAASALETSLAAQRTDGSWNYAEGRHGDWVDNFHTGYVLQSLAHCIAVRPEVEHQLLKGLEYWQRELFQVDGTPRPAPGRDLPIDAHDYATAIETWLAMPGDRNHAVDRSRRLARLLVDRMLDPKGFVRFQQRRYWTNKTPFVRWTTAPSFRALAALHALDRRTSG
jgi:hypothetical protein